MMGVNRDTQILTNITSLISTSFVVLSNLLYGWGNPTIVINGCLPVMLAHNSLDLILHIRTNDWLMTLHHIMVVSGIGYYYYDSYEFTPEIVNYVKWILLAEISSLFNSLRYHLVGTKYYLVSKISFGIIFLWMRLVSSIGVISWLIKHKNEENYNVFLILSLIYVFLNIVWGSMIMIQLSKKRDILFNFLNIGLKNR